MSLYEAAKDAVKIAQKADNVELIQKILDIQKEALDMQDKLQKKNEEIDKLKKEIEELNTHANYRLEKSVMWSSEDTEYSQPFCPTCYSKGRIVPMQKTWDGADRKQSLYHCSDTKCGTVANPWDYKQESVINSGGGDTYFNLDNQW